MKVPTRGVVGDSCHSATRPDLLFGDSVSPNLKGENLVFSYICKALYSLRRHVPLPAFGEVFHSRGIWSRISTRLPPDIPLTFASTIYQLPTSGLRPSYAAVASPYAPLIHWHIPRNPHVSAQESNDIQQYPGDAPGTYLFSEHARIRFYDMRLLESRHLITEIDPEIQH